MLLIVGTVVGLAVVVDDVAVAAAAAAAERAVAVLPSWMVVAVETFV